MGEAHCPLSRSLLREGFRAERVPSTRPRAFLSQLGGNRHRIQMRTPETRTRGLGVQFQLELSLDRGLTRQEPGQGPPAQPWGRPPGESRGGERRQALWMHLLRVGLCPGGCPGRVLCCSAPLLPSWPFCLGPGPRRPQYHCRNAGGGGGLRMGAGPDHLLMHPASPPDSAPASRPGLWAPRRTGGSGVQLQRRPVLPAAPGAPSPSSTARAHRTHPSAERGAGSLGKPKASGSAG